MSETSTAIDHAKLLRRHLWPCLICLLIGMALGFQIMHMTKVCT